MSGGIYPKGKHLLAEILGGQDEGAGLAYIYYCNLSVTRRASGK